MKEGNVLGSGPSRISYIPNNLPTIGCNFPWTRVDWTLIFDYQPTLKWLETPSVFPQKLPFIISEHTYKYLKTKNLLHKIRHRIIDVFKKHNLSSIEFAGSSGHYATEWMIRQGFTKLNLYGMDNYFGDLKVLDNFSHQPGTLHYIDNINLTQYSEETLLRRGREWQISWKRIIKYNPNVEFNFIR
jgi:hypothetical protein